jgi:peptidoglycan L-alanyl-D-glutamate endopeptidase CwlK
MSRRLDDLSPRFRPLAFQLLARTVEAGIPVVIVDTLRTAAEHQANLAKGVSWTARSRHLDGDAIDICPYATWDAAGPDKLNWNVNDPAWKRLGEIGESLGLRWGGRWRQRDLGHFEYVERADDDRQA